MSPRATRRKKATVSRKETIRVLLVVTVLAGIPILGTAFIAAVTTEPDLSVLSPISERAGNSVLLNWSKLLEDGRYRADAEIGALGYMFDGDRPVHNGELVSEFVLLPEAGNVLHPAHRIRDQMVTVRLQDGEQIRFAQRALIWVWGRFQASSESGSADTLYRLEDARAQFAERADVHRYFR